MPNHFSLKLQTTTLRNTSTKSLCLPLTIFIASSVQRYVSFTYKYSRYVDILVEEDRSKTEHVNTLLFSIFNPLHNLQF